MADKRRRQTARERARIEEERRKRARTNRRIGIAAALIVVAIAVVLIVTLTGSSGTFSVQYVSATPTDASTLAGILKSAPPWPTNTADLPARLSAVSLPALGAMEGQALHIHQHIDIYIQGQHVVVPALVGIAISGSSVLYAPIHTHDATGIIHVESPVARDFSLGEFFDVWGVLFTPTCIGTYCNTGSERLEVFANGKVVTGDPRQVKLLEHEEIVVTFGTPDQIPRPYPVSYRFPSGL